MRQLTFVKAGQPLEWRDVPAPRVQGPGEAIVRPVVVASDNLPDAWRTVGPYLEEQPGAPVLVVGGWGAGSIGLYAVAIAKALGNSQIDYCDAGPAHLELAGTLGARPIEVKDTFPKRFGSYPITVKIGPPQGVASVLRSTAPDGVCTSVGIYFLPPRLPLLEMYTLGVTFKTSRVMARAIIPKVLDLVTSGRLHPEQITSDQATWDEAGVALLSHRTKLVIAR